MAAERSPAVLSAAVGDAQRLLSHAARHGLGLDEATIGTIVGAKQLLQEDAAPADRVERETAFWLAFEQLAVAVSPVTVASLEATTELGEDRSLFALAAARVTGERRRVTAAGLAVRRTKHWAIFSLVGLLLLQIYWLIGSTVAGNLPRLQQEVQQIQEQARQREARLEQEGREPGGDKELQGLTAGMDNLGARIGVNYEILEQWLNILRIAGGVERVVPGEQNQQFARLSQSLATAQFVLLALQTYLLPLLYGLLGAVTYVLRSMAQEIKALTYTREADIGYRLRMIMGALAGLVVAWFLTPTLQDNGSHLLESLSPFALAFLAGYSVELLFAGLDRIVAAFAGGRQ